MARIVAVDSALEKAGVGQTTAVVRYGGKSGLLRTGRQVTPGGRESTESATENIPPAFVFVTIAGKGEKVR